MTLGLPGDPDPRYEPPEEEEHLEPDDGHHDHYAQRAERIAWLLIGLTLLAIAAGVTALVWRR